MQQSKGKHMKDGGPAFPNAPQITLNAEGTWPAITSPQNGMSLRQFYAGMALSGMITYAYKRGPEFGFAHPDTLAREAFALADAMIKEGEK